VHPELCPALMVVTIRRELAGRLIARPVSAASGAVSVLVQALAEVSIVRVLPPSVFWTRHKVDSAVVAIRPDADKRARVGDVGWFHQLVRQVFLHRRKSIRHVLADLWRDEWAKPEVDAWLEGQGLNGPLRAESLDVEDFIELAHALRERFPALDDPDAARSDEPAGHGPCRRRDRRRGLMPRPRAPVGAVHMLSSHAPMSGCEDRGFPRWSVVIPNVERSMP
jgi:16S rRNA (adenine1518-N6/adenine1519-N6)-dimethyltransferase